MTLQPPSNILSPLAFLSKSAYLTTLNLSHKAGVIAELIALSSSMPRITYEQAGENTIRSRTSLSVPPRSFRDFISAQHKSHHLHNIDIRAKLYVRLNNTNWTSGASTNKSSNRWGLRSTGDGGFTVLGQEAGGAIIVSITFSSTKLRKVFPEHLWRILGFSTFFTFLFHSLFGARKSYPTIKPIFYFTPLRYRQE